MARTLLRPSFMDWQQIGETAARAVLVYAVMLVVIRVLGKRTIGNFTAFDLLVALMLGEVVDEIIYGDVSLTQGFVAIFVIAGAKYVTGWLTYFDHGLNRILEGNPTEIVRNGQFVRRGLRAEMMNQKEAMAALRIKGVSDLREVKVAVVEADGEVSVIREEWAEPLQKGDVRGAERGETPQPMRTDSPEALGA